MSVAWHACVSVELKLLELTVLNKDFPDKIGEMLILNRTTNYFVIQSQGFLTYF